MSFFSICVILEALGGHLIMYDVVTTNIFENLCPILERFFIPEEKIREIFDEEPDLLKTVVKIFSHGYSEETLEWFLMPLKVYNPTFLESVLDRVSDSNSINNVISGEFVNTMILAKQKAYRDDFESSFGDILSHDYFERISLMMCDISVIHSFALEYLTYFRSEKLQDNLAYIATDFPCAQFVESLGSTEPSWHDFFCTLFNLYAKLFRSFVNKNISCYQANKPTFAYSDIDIVVPNIADDSSIYCGDFADLLEFVLDKENTKNAKMKLFPLLKSFYEDKKYNSKEIYSFLGRLSSAPDSFFSFLGENIDNQYIHFLLEDELRNPSNLFHHLSDFSDETREPIYQLLTNCQYSNFSSNKRECLLNCIKDYNLESVESLRAEFEDGFIDFDRIDDIHNFFCLFQYLSSSNKREFMNKVKAIHAVSHQLDAHYLDRYLWYLGNSDLHKKREYKAHSAYFKTHSIDKFFDCFDSGCSWKKDVLLMTTDDKKMKNQQMRLVKKCPVFNLKDSIICNQVLNTIQYSYDAEEVRSVVSLVINPLFSELTTVRQQAVLGSYAPRCEKVVVTNEEDSLEIIIPNFEASFEHLPEGGFVKCKSMGKDGSPIELLVGRHKK